LLANRIGYIEALIVSAGIEGYGKVEERLAILQADIGAGGIDQR
jgi:hypothetical protein